MNAMDVALICKALGDANRLEIVQMLSDGEKMLPSYLNKQAKVYRCRRNSATKQRFHHLSCQEKRWNLVII